jgi:hypothetical protein
MAEQILADKRHTTTREDIRQAVRERTTRGMLTFNTGKVHRLEGELWAVPSTRGGFHQVDLGDEECGCEDFTFYGSVVGVACRHVYAAAIARASRRSGVKVRAVSAAGDPFAYAGDKRRGCFACYDGWVYLGEAVDDDVVEVDEHTERVPCRRCSPGGRA